MFKKIFQKFAKKDENKKEETIEEIVEEAVEEAVEEDENAQFAEDEPKSGQDDVILDEAAADEYGDEKTAEEMDSEEEACQEIQTVETSQEEADEQEINTEQAALEEQAETEEQIEAEELIETEEEAPKAAQKLNLFSRLKEGLSKTKKGITERIDNVLKAYGKIDEELFEELEEILITSDMGFETTMAVIEGLKERIKRNKITQAEMVREELKEVLVEMLSSDEASPVAEKTPAIVLVIGVNGVGKTTTIGKLSNRFKGEGKNVIIAAGDTFRAAAIDQLEVWAQRTGVEIIRHSEGSDPGAVIFDAIHAAKSRNADILICDTAGRLHNKKNLMNELGKIFKIVEREYPEAFKEVLLVVDATTGQNAVQQAKVFNEVADITGVVLTKLDGTAKGGVILAVKTEVNVPVKLIGVGEKAEDLQDFDARSFVEALFE